MPDPEIFDMPVELRLELVTIIRTHFPNTEWKLFNDVVNEIDGVCLRVFLIDLERANSGRVVDRRILESADLSPLFPLNVRNLTST